MIPRRKVFLDASMDPRILLSLQLAPVTLILYERFQQHGKEVAESDTEAVEVQIAAASHSCPTTHLTATVL